MDLQLRVFTAKFAKCGLLIHVTTIMYFIRIHSFMQIDLDHSGIPRDQILHHGPFSEGHVDQAVSLKLVPDYYTMSRKYPNITNEKTFQG